jgi:hypothetical protein
MFKIHIIGQQIYWRLHTVSVVLYAHQKVRLKKIALVNIIMHTSLFVHLTDGRRMEGLEMEDTTGAK